MNCQAVAQLMIQFRKGIESNPEVKVFNLNRLHLIYLLSKDDPTVWEQQYGHQYAIEVAEATRRILEEHGLIESALAETL
ncbi:hypothetical protein MUK70_11625 [Dyadobacter chenwenxiniae]|uniref:Uncharacterized protein n=1 Tax=Dyadobacter chenwenxiniae TaxID=2906456 RepID=A0A9X1TCN4_9BACT|nr:hypothetical protein [Dyadobacter chenwenxiniae]MCF0059889.1 hypothetical protein [Dyadobacter chenwenxiniae]UON85629.1 hypothetical protein MUK70_11625 [Dyadobacter chenwenxiniae]